MGQAAKRVVDGWRRCSRVILPLACDARTSAPLALDVAEAAAGAGARVQSREQLIWTNDMLRDVTPAVLSMIVLFIDAVRVEVAGDDHCLAAEMHTPR